MSDLDSMATQLVALEARRVELQQEIADLSSRCEAAAKELESIEYDLLPTAQKSALDELRKRAS